MAVTDHHLDVRRVVLQQVLQALGCQRPLVSILMRVGYVAGLLNAYLHKSAAAKQNYNKKNTNNYYPFH